MAQSSPTLTSSLNPPAIDPKKRRSRHKYIREMFNRGFRLGNEREHRWKKEFTGLWRLRNDEIHHEERAQVPVLHHLGTHPGRPYVMYSAGTASRAVDLFLDMMDVFTSQAKHELFHERSQGYRSAYDDLVTKRQELRERVEQETAALVVEL